MKLDSIPNPTKNPPTCQKVIRHPERDIKLVVKLTNAIPRNYPTEIIANADVLTLTGK
jgi:hypothetical protein